MLSCNDEFLSGGVGVRSVGVVCEMPTDCPALNGSSQSCGPSYSPILQPDLIAPSGLPGYLEQKFEILKQNSCQFTLCLKKNTCHLYVGNPQKHTSNKRGSKVSQGCESLSIALVFWERGHIHFREIICPQTHHSPCRLHLASWVDPDLSPGGTPVRGWF